MADKISFGRNNNGLQVGVNEGNIHFTPDADEIERQCLRAFDGPDTSAVKDQVTRSNDKMRPALMEWVFRTKEYRSWQEDQACLLLIKGGAGKGKTMIAIGIINKLLSLPADPSLPNRPFVVYFFCRNGDRDLNTIAGIIKGLIVRLIHQDGTLVKFLQDHWDSDSNMFLKDTSSWLVLWDILSKMLDRCRCISTTYIIVDALDECEEDISEFLDCIVRNGLYYNERLKWLLTSRPVDNVERKLLGTSEQTRVSLELNHRSVSQAVRGYIVDKVAELDRHARYGESLRRQVEAELIEKAEGTFLWVSLVCKNLRNVRASSTLGTLHEIPPGLPAFYARAWKQLEQGEQDDVESSIRLLRAVMLVRRPLNSEEIGSVIGLVGMNIEDLVDRCTSFLKIVPSYKVTYSDRYSDPNVQEILSIESVHQSARDFVERESTRSQTSLGQLGHYDIALNCVSFLHQNLKFNLAELPTFDSDVESSDTRKKAIRFTYAVEFWTQHAYIASRDADQKNPIDKHAFISFIQHRLLEWVECLCLTVSSDDRPLFEVCQIALDGLLTLQRMFEENTSTMGILKGAIEFVQQTLGMGRPHYSKYPLQLYCAISLRPESCPVRRENLGTVPTWIKPPLIPFTPLQRVIGRKAHRYSSRPRNFNLAFSSGSETGAYYDIEDNGIWAWDIMTCGNQRFLPLDANGGRIFVWDISPDGMNIAFGSKSDPLQSFSALQIWNSSTAVPTRMKTDGEQALVYAAVFSPNGNTLASCLKDLTVKIWDTMTGHELRTLRILTHDSFPKVAFSPDGMQIVTGGRPTTLEPVQIWSSINGQNLIKLHGSVGIDSHTLAFSPNGKLLATCGYGASCIIIWSLETGRRVRFLNFERENYRYYSVHSPSWMAFSPDSKQLAASSGTREEAHIRLWSLHDNFRPSKHMGDTLNRFVLTRPTRKLNTNPDNFESASLFNWALGHRYLHFTLDSQYLVTNRGFICLESSSWYCPNDSLKFRFKKSLKKAAATLKLTPSTSSSEQSGYMLTLEDGWICFNDVRFFLLPLRLSPEYCYVKGDTVSIGTLEYGITELKFDISQLTELVDALPKDGFPNKATAPVFTRGFGSYH